MPRTDFDALPDHARVWVFPVQDELSGTEVELLLQAVDGFLDG